MADFNPRNIKAWKQEVKGAKQDLAEIADLSAQLAKSTKNLTDSQIENNKNLSQIVDSSKAAAQQGKMNLEQLKERVDLIKDISKGEMDLNSIKEKEESIEKEIIKIKRRYGGVNKEKGNQLASELEFNLELLGAEKERVLAEEQSKSLLEAQDMLTGGMASKMKEFTEAFKMGLGPQMLMLAGITAIVALVSKFSEGIDAVGDEFGAIGVQQFSSDLMAADAELARIGMDAGTAASITTELADNFGVGVEDAIGMAAAVGDMSKALGLSAQEGAQLMGTFTTMGGMTPQQAEDTAKMAAQLANANNVNPSAVLKDIAGSTETFAKFGKDGGTNLVEAAVVAKKLGTNLDSVAATMEGMLDFANSTTKAMEASVLLGRDINIQKLQELSLAGDAAGVLEEQKRLLGDAEKFNSMNVIQRKALAESLGLSVEQANKMVNAQEDAASLAGELAKQPGFEELVGKEALSSLSQLMGSLTSIAAVLTNVLGPPLNFIVGIFAEGFNVINSVIDTLMEFPALATIVGGALALMSGKFLITAIAGVWAGVTSIMSIPFVGPVLAGIAAAGLISTIYKAIAGAGSQKVGDAFMQGGGGPVVTTPQGQSFEGSVRDEVLMAPGIAGAQAATAAAGGGGNMAVVDAINNLNTTTKDNKPPSAKDVGKRTGRALEQLGDG